MKKKEKNNWMKKKKMKNEENINEIMKWNKKEKI